MENCLLGTKMRILVTGSNGFIGNHLVKKLTGLGYEIVMDNPCYHYRVKHDYDRKNDIIIMKKLFEKWKLI